MSDAIVSAVIEQLISAATAQIHHEINLVRGVEEELLDLSNKLKNVRRVLDDADMKQFKDDMVKDWLHRLEQTSYEMEDVLEEWNYAIRQHEVESGSGSAPPPPPKHKVCSFIPSSCFCFKKLVVRRDTAQKIQILKSKLDGLLKEKDEFNFLESQPENDPSPASWRVTTTSFINPEVQGREYDKEILTKKLTTNVGSDYQILSIVGAGGLGKTTLAQLVYNDIRVEECFGLRIWICVSDPFDVVGLVKGIIESIKPRSSPDTNQLDACLKILKDFISGKKFLLVLDDVWNEDREKWESLKIALMCGGAGSKILVTTRNENVATIMGTVDEDIHRPELLSDEDCRLLLMQAALPGKSQDEFVYFQEIGQKMAKKCKGLPLAAKTLGSVLLSKNTIQEWDKVFKSEIWKLEKAELKLFPHLLLSYRELSPMLKQCFSFYAFFPKDTKLEVEELIRIWMALHYLGSNTKSAEEDMELKGREIFNDLAMRSLFQRFGKDKTTEQLGSCKMHDIVHDFTQFLRKNGKVEAHGMAKKSREDCDPFSGPHIQEYCRLFWEKEPPPHFCDCLTRLRVLNFKRDSEMRHCPRGMGKLIHLTWMDIRGTTLSKEDLETICKLYFLQTLLLSHCCIKEIPEEIGNLVHLKHLSLGWNGIKELPESMGSLSELQTLLLNGCSIEEIPEEIMNWDKLRHLDLSNNAGLKKLPERICSFHKLETLGIADCWSLGSYPEGLVARLPSMHSLTGFLGGSGCNKFELLKNLNNLHGSLNLMVQFSGDCDVEELVRDAREAELRNKIHLQELTISFSIMNEISGGAKECSSSSSSLSLWVDIIEAFEPNEKLQDLEIWGYQGLRLPNWISSPCNQLRKISLNWCSEMLSPPPLGKLPFLKELELRDFVKMKMLGVEWLGIRGREGEGEAIYVPSSSPHGAFPRLKRLVFQSCNEWCEWEDITADEEASTLVSLMPCLSQLHIWSCVGLKMLPHRLLHKASSLRILDISDSSELMKCYEDNDGSPWRSISQHNPQLQIRTHW